MIVVKNGIEVNLGNGEWREIEGYQGYFVSKDGKIFSQKTSRLFRPGKTRTGYVLVHFRVNRKQYAEYLHRLVATAFIPNPKGMPSVNHIDGNKENNTVCNLEWVTPSENTQHAYNTGLIVKKSKPFFQMTLEGEVIRRFRTLEEAYRETKIRPASIGDVLYGKKQSAGGFFWKYDKEGFGL